jgi:drug/metabolite transporter (DMT)-like permease
MLVIAGAIYGTYPVLLRALKSVGGEPLPAVFVSFVRYQFLTLFAFSLRAVRAVQQKRDDKSGGVTAKKSGSSTTTATSRRLWIAAAELAAHTVVASLLGIYGVSRVPAVTSEILSSMVNLFVPLQTLVLVGGSSLGVTTWLGCAIAFCAALISCLSDADGGAVGGGDLVGQAALVGAAFAFGMSRVRAQVHLREHPTEALNTARMLSMGGLSFLVLLADVALGGASRRTLTRLGHVVPAQWALMALSVFLSAFVAASLSFSALSVISAANAQPFAALQPVFVALWSMLLLSEPISRGAIIGGTMMIGATLLACTDKA